MIRRKGSKPIRGKSGKPISKPAGAASPFEFDQTLDVLVEIAAEPEKFQGTERTTIYGVAQHVMRSVARALESAMDPAPSQNLYLAACASFGQTRLRGQKAVTDVIEGWKQVHRYEYGEDVDQLDEDLARLKVGSVSFPDFRGCGYVGGRCRGLNLHDQPRKLLSQIGELKRYLSTPASSLYQLSILTVLREQPTTPTLYAQAMEDVLADFFRVVERRAVYAREILARGTS